MPSPLGDDAHVPAGEHDGQLRGAPRRVRAQSPVRVADCGGWTDTWFARTGLVCSVAVGPGATVTISETDEVGLVLGVGATGEEYRLADSDLPGHHALLESAIATYASAAPNDFERDMRREPNWGMQSERNRGLRIDVGADVPPGCGVGTSAAVVVALLAALDAWHGVALDPVALAVRAHRIETGLGWQAGVQDQHAAAHGGAARILVNYPDAVHERLVVPDSAWAALGERLITVYVGRPHSSSAVHEQVIARLESVESEPLLAPLRLAASRAARALEIGDLAAWGEALVANTDAQAALDPRLIGDDMHRLIAIARRHGAAGWKVNGAGGDGGSVTLLGPVERDRHAALIRAVDATPGWTRLGLTPTTLGVHLSD